MDEHSKASQGLDLNAFVGALAHDLANPLNAISMNAELARMLSDKNQPERMREISDRILADCARCSRFLRDLRQFADAVKQRPRESVPLSSLLDAAELQARAAVMQGFPQLDVSGANIALSVDRIAFEAALSALLRNAAEAGATRAEVAAIEHTGMVTLTLTDNGSGIAAATAARIGAPFFSTRHAQGNTGLGLATCRQVAHAHGGQFALRSEDGQTVASLSVRAGG